MGYCDNFACLMRHFDDKVTYFGGGENNNYSPFSWAAGGTQASRQADQIHSAGILGSAI